MDLQPWTRPRDAFLRVAAPGSTSPLPPPGDGSREGDGASAVGRRVGPFVLEAFVQGRGPEAVFRARRWDDRRGRGVAAVKVLRSRSPDPAVLRSFEREHRSLAALRHPALPAILGSGTTPDGWAWFATEFVVGRPLVEHVTAERSGLAARIQLMLEISRAIEHAHGRHVVHTDLRRECLVVTPAGAPKVLGFGRPGHEVGGDVEALGRILFEVLSGARPHLTVLRGGAPPGPAYLPRRRPRPRQGVDHVCLQAIRSRGREGYPSAGALAADLQRVLDRRPVSAGPEGWASRVRDSLGRWLEGSGRTA